MALATTCPKCPSTSFEIADAKVKGSNYHWKFVRCAKCGAAINVVPAINTNALLEVMAKALGIKLP